MACLVILLSSGSALAWVGEVVRVYDGDTIEVKRGDTFFRIRLYGIDAPEYKRPFSNKAKKLTKRLVLNKQVEITEKDIDKYGRIVALVAVGNKLVNEELLRSGLAWVYTWFCREQPLCDDWAQLEEKARSEKRGLWRTRRK